MKKYVSILILFVCVYANAQLSPNSLFIVFDNSEGVLKTERKEEYSNTEKEYIFTKYSYKFHKEEDYFFTETQKRKEYLVYEKILEKEGFYVNLKHLKGHNYIFLLPKGLLDSFKEAEKVKTISEMEEIWNSINWSNHSFFLDGYRYYFQLPIMQRGHYRDAIFMVFTSDLGKDYIPCYEVNNYSHQEGYE